MNTHLSITNFAAFVELKDFRGPTKKEYVPYVRRLGDHFKCDPATLTEDQLRVYYLELRQVRKFGASAAGPQVRGLRHESRQMRPALLLLRAPQAWPRLDGLCRSAHRRPANVAPGSPPGTGCRLAQGGGAATVSHYPRLDLSHRLARRRSRPPRTPRSARLTHRTSPAPCPLR